MGDFFRHSERRPAQVDKNLPEDERLYELFRSFVRNYYRVLLGVDENVGRVLDFLDKEGLADNTIVVYTSDNGFFLGEHGFYDKRMMLEPSIRVPMLLRWPQRIKAGQVDDEHMVLNIDVAPTLLSLARSEEHTSELQSLMRNSYAVFCLKKKKNNQSEKKKTESIRNQ